jgi:hypothetical protein
MDLLIGNNTLGNIVIAWAKAKAIWQQNWPKDMSSDHG